MDMAAMHRPQDGTVLETRLQARRHVRATPRCRDLRERRQRDIGYWGVAARRLVALLLAADDRCASLAAFVSMALGAM